MAEEKGFEPLRRVTDLLVFETSPFSHLGIPPTLCYDLRWPWPPVPVICL